MTDVFKLDLDTPAYKGTISFPTGLFIGGEWVKPVEGLSIEVINPANASVITSVSIGTEKDVDVALEAAQRAYKSSWGLKVPGTERGKMLAKLADLVEANLEEFAAIESLNCGWFFTPLGLVTVDAVRYFAGWADKIHGRTMETNENKLAYTRHEPWGVVGAIIPWNFPLTNIAWKLAPTLATGNVLVLKPSEITPLPALKLASLIPQAGFPPGVINIVNGYGSVVGARMASHPGIAKLAFTGSTLTGRKIQEAAARSNLKAVTLELGGKSPNIIFEDADLEQAVKWAGIGVFTNMGQACCAGTRIFVQELVYDQFMELFKKNAEALQAGIGEPFELGTMHGPQVSKGQYEKVLSYISSGISAGATLVTGGTQHPRGTKQDSSPGYYISPTIFGDCRPDMKIVKEEIFGPVAAVIKFKDEEEVISLANDTSYGLACGVFTQNSSRAIRVAHALEAGTAWVNCYMTVELQVPFGGYKESGGGGRELGIWALDTYTQVKSVHVNIGMRL
ncbi:hypothetical protein VKT23_011679 [Stygiomarasmius scandens]|uniref:Aldehyde dehydrogenase domain-containing protein n=1 Tax=Marasmiellus scandens TaxID=2682957 RepID=A0ABR1JAE4_9AGAR